jgi:hypothetical protein
MGGWNEYHALELRAIDRHGPSRQVSGMKWIERATQHSNSCHG